MGKQQGQRDEQQDRAKKTARRRPSYSSFQRRARETTLVAQQQRARDRDMERDPKKSSWRHKAVMTSSLGRLCPKAFVATRPRPVASKTTTTMSRAFVAADGKYARHAVAKDEIVRVKFVPRKQAALLPAPPVLLKEGESILDRVGEIKLEEAPRGSSRRHKKQRRETGRPRKPSQEQRLREAATNAEKLRKGMSLEELIASASEEEPLVLPDDLFTLPDDVAVVSLEDLEITLPESIQIPEDILSVPAPVQELTDLADRATAEVVARMVGPDGTVAWADMHVLRREMFGLPIEREYWQKNRAGEQVPGAARCQARTGSGAQCASATRPGCLTCFAHRDMERVLEAVLSPAETYFPLVLADLDIQIPSLEDLELQIPSLEYLKELFTLPTIPDGLIMLPPRQPRIVVRTSWRESWREPKEGEVANIAAKLDEADNIFDVEEDCGVELGNLDPRSRLERSVRNSIQMEKKLAAAYKKVCDRTGKRVCRACFRAAARPAYQAAFEAAIEAAQGEGLDLRSKETWDEITKKAFDAAVSAAIEANLEWGNKPKIEAVVPLKVYLDTRGEDENGGESNTGESEPSVSLGAIEHPWKMVRRHISDQGGEVLCEDCVKANKPGKPDKSKSYTPKRHGNRGFGDRHPSKVRRSNQERRAKKGSAGSGRNASICGRQFPQPTKLLALDLTLDAMAHIASAGEDLEPDEFKGLKQELLRRLADMAEVPREKGELTKRIADFAESEPIRFAEAVQTIRADLEREANFQKAIDEALTPSIDASKQVPNVEEIDFSRTEEIEEGEADVEYTIVGALFISNN